MVGNRQSVLGCSFASIIPIAIAYVAMTAGCEREENLPPCVEVVDIYRDACESEVSRPDDIEYCNALSDDSVATGCEHEYDALLECFMDADELDCDSDLEDAFEKTCDDEALQAFTCMYE